MSYSKEEIIIGIKSRKDRMVLNWMYKYIYPKVKSYILANSGTEDDSKDVFQEAVLTFYNLVMNNKSDKITDVEGFVLVVARNKWINKVRTKKKEINTEFLENESDNQNGPLVNMILNEKWNAFQDLIDQIGERCKELLAYSLYEKLSMTEIAERMGFISADAAKTTHYRCKQKMIDLVTKNKQLGS